MQDLSKFMPLDMRIRFVQELIGKMGTRPLANAIGVNSKTVYKYNHNMSCPTDETMMKILVVAKENHPELFEKYASKLRDDFSSAFTGRATLEYSFASKQKAKTEPKFISEPSKHPSELKSKVKPLEITKFEIYDKLSITSPADRMVVAKLIMLMQGMEKFKLEDIMRKSNIEYDVVQKYIETLVESGYLSVFGNETYQLSVKVIM